MKEKTAPKKTWLQTLRALWVPLAIGIVTVAALALVVGAVWQDYRTALDVYKRQSLRAARRCWALPSSSAWHRRSAAS